MEKIIYVYWGIALVFTGIAIAFKLEKEHKPVLVSLLFAGFFITLYFILQIFEQRLQIVLTTLFVSIALVSFIVLLIPFRNKNHIKAGIVSARFDERDIMFSRNELNPGTKRFDDYYRRNPDKKTLDDKFREKPGLLSKKATKYHPFKFASAEANFMAVEAFVPYKKETLNKAKQKIDAQELSAYIKKWLKQIGTVNTGITELKDYHLYSHKGRGDEYGKEIHQSHTFAIAFTVEMDKEMLDMAPGAETIMESSQQYLHAGNIAVQLAVFIRNLGYSALPHFDGNYQVICPVVARDAGLGELGRMGLLMTPELGPRVRIGVVTTDIPLVVDEYHYEASVIDFCTSCKKCADNCPSRAIMFDNMQEIDGVIRWKINHEACFTYWNIVGTDCGKCIQVCPYAHPDNLLHNLVRKGIKNSYLFAQMALKMDDVFYGRKPDNKHYQSPLS
ncbi:MAG: 4Fe-4S dicluster domain-containing protein [Bacteroidales bacterium]|nr:4Fe-4S dicluster domain-containing protein [Bacteroidales bacterium]